MVFEILLAAIKDQGKMAQRFGSTTCRQASILYRCGTSVVPV